jgi:hypothetical protein
MTVRPSEVVSLSRTELALLCTAAVLLPTGRLLLAISGLDRARWTVGRLAGVLPPRAGVEEPDRIPPAIRCASRHLPGTYACLAQAVVGEALLAASGYRATVRLGVSGRAAEFEAHAWVERRGDVVLGDLDDLDRFRQLTTWHTDP